MPIIRAVTEKDVLFECQDRVRRRKIYSDRYATGSGHAKFAYEEPLQPKDVWNSEADGWHVTVVMAGKIVYQTSELAIDL